MFRPLLAHAIMCFLLGFGCSAPQTPRAKELIEKRSPRVENPSSTGKPHPDSATQEQSSSFQLAAETKNPDGDAKPPLEGKPPAPEEAKDSIVPEPLSSERPDPPNALYLPEVVASVHGTYPLIEAALQEMTIANGNRLAAWGEFDLKLKAESENGPTGFYQTYRQSIGVLQPLYHGGETFAGYRIGRGDYQPWYLERETNDGGEFKAGIQVPLARNRDIDARRAQLWRADYDQQLAQPEIRRQLIEFVREASITYWIWVAAGRKYEIGKTALRLAEDRNEGFEKRVQQGDLDPPVLKDNERAIASREAKVLDLERKLKQSAVKLSLFYRTADGTPLIPDAETLPNFPEPTPIDPACQVSDVETALAMRPELESLELLRQRTEVDAAEASNDLLPNVDAQLIGSQDVGHPTSEKRDKSQFELEVGVFVDVPLQRRKGFGKLGATQGKLAQLAAKRQFTEDKIVAEVQAIYAGLVAAYERVLKTREAREGAELLATVERRKLELGESDLLAVFQREQLAVEAADDEVDALLEYFIARADYAAALAYQWVNQQAEPQQQTPE